MGVFKVLFFNNILDTAYTVDIIKNIQIYPIYRLISKNILNPNNTRKSPIPNGFFNILEIAKIKRERSIPTIKALSGI